MKYNYYTPKYSTFRQKKIVVKRMYKKVETYKQVKFSEARLTVVT